MSYSFTVTATIPPETIANALRADPAFAAHVLDLWSESWRPARIAAALRDRLGADARLEIAADLRAIADLATRSVIGAPAASETEPAP